MSMLQTDDAKTLKQIGLAIVGMVIVTITLAITANILLG